MPDAIRFVHVLSALLFFGGLLPCTCLLGGVLRLREPAARLAGLRLLSSANRRFMLPGSILSGLSGFALSGMKPVPIGAHPWLMASVALYLLSFVASMAVLAPHSKRLVAAAEAAVQSGASAELDGLAAKPVPRWTRVGVGLAGVAIGVLMVWRP
jgi:uncharacterized membrane protein